ncbi:RHS repeat-associated core domain-containing protein [Pseudescherichia vulneris]|uniref:RHS repeat-associated core domain-containing protein n=1 Tax=Pseudescherichia vulneris TaxID=566 RepID=UPI001EDF6422|nr:RHS repeat-associated core domain-containing protein [Pseudescherichia vulneris]
MILQITGNNMNGSPALSLSGGNSITFAWSPFGGGAARVGNAASLPGFNGERQDPLSRVTHLGNGYRAYSPALRRFTCPDSESPFGVGGVNPYVYCDHDPVNNTDPSGHGPVTWLVRKVITLGVRLGIASEETTDSMASGLVTAGTVETGTALSTQVSTGVAQQVVRARGNTVAATELGWATLGMGMAGGLGLAEGDIGKTVRRLRGSAKTYRVAEANTLRYGRVSDLYEEGVTHLAGEEDDTVTGIQYFIDEHDYNLTDEAIEQGIAKKPRLNVAAHGEYIPVIDKRTIVSVNGHKMSAENIVNELKNRFGDLSQFSEIRTIICHSADSRVFSKSLGQQIANISGLPVESFRGTVSRYGHLPFKLYKNAQLITDGSENYRPKYFYPVQNKLQKN